MEAKICKCCGAPLKDNVCGYCGVSYEKTYSSDKIVESVYNTKCSQLSEFLNGNYIQNTFSKSRLFIFVEFKKTVARLPKTQG